MNIHRDSRIHSDSRIHHDSDASQLTHNGRAWDRLAASRHPLARPATDRQFEDPLAAVDGPGWLCGDIRGRRVLCLAAGGGSHGPLYAAAGADVTVVDTSAEMLRLDRHVAQERSIDLRTVFGSMEDLSVFKRAEFDIVIQPVSTCYVADIANVYRQVAGVLCAGGLYVSQHKQPTSLQTSLTPSGGNYYIHEPYYRDQPLPPADASLVREPGTIEFLHRWEMLLGQMCRAGFVIEDMIEPLHARADAAPGSFAHRSRFVAPYVRIKSRRTDDR